MLKQITPHVWVLPGELTPHHTQPNIGIIVTERETVVIDAGNGGPHAEQIKTAVSHLTATPITHLIYTHHHWDHVFGAYALNAPTVIANQRSLPFLHDKQQTPWGEPFLQHLWNQQPRLRLRTEHQLRAAGTWADLRIIMPTQTFNKTLHLPLTGLTLTLTHVGGRHAPDSIVIHLPEERLLFVGDSYYAPPQHELQPGEPEIASLPMLETLLAYDVDWFIDGHNEPLRYRELEFVARWQQLRS